MTQFCRTGARGPRRRALALAALAALLGGALQQGAALAAEPAGSGASAASPDLNVPPAAPAPAFTAPAAPAAPVAQSAPGSAAALEAPAGGSAAMQANINRQLRFGGTNALFRNLIPSPALEAQASAEFNEIVRGAAHADRLYPDSDPHAQRVRAIVERLEPYSLKWSDRVKNWKWEIAVIRSPDIRMYCLPGGKIVVYSGLLDRVKLNDNELGVLFGHEIAHAVREHARERLGEQQAARLDSGSVPQLFGLADLGVFPLGIGERLMDMRYGRADETEADVIGSDIASRAGFDPRAAITLWDKLANATRRDGEQGANQGFIYVHPYPPSRRDDIMKRLPDMLPLYAKAIGKPLDSLPDYAGIGRPKRRVVSAP